MDKEAQSHRKCTDLRTCAEIDANNMGPSNNSLNKSWCGGQQESPECAPVPPPTKADAKHPVEPSLLLLSTSLAQHRMLSVNSW